MVKTYVRLVKIVNIFNASYFKSILKYLQDITSWCLLVAVQVFLSISDEQEQIDETQDHPTEN